MKTLVFLWFVASASVAWKVYFGIMSPDYDGSRMESLIGMAGVWVLLSVAIIAVWIFGKLRRALSGKTGTKPAVRQS
ncbi:hypothetical protein [Aliiroseovarius sp. F47248L]|uniref:hypothetical protein n=1 Tax=Aliiroseovarius sp. F47248L TaxID=2926420 RepID=UPI001FF5A9A5|nr:hypothetical protein [Aliiroseovarius sp. F47248L]MCK0138012.1 hypothetical protein [Aliiroseovarius sp. F47248L]